MDSIISKFFIVQFILGRVDSFLFMQFKLQVVIRNIFYLYNFNNLISIKICIHI
jgi:hypothetical protein